MALTTLDQIKIACRIPLTNTSEDAFLTQTLPYVERLIKDYIHQEIESANYVEYYDGTNTEILKLNQGPVWAVTEIRDDPAGNYGQNAGQFASNSILTAGVDYALVPDLIDGVSSRKRWVKRLTGVWEGAFYRTRGLLSPELKVGRGNLKVTYSAGYPTPNNPSIPLPVDLTMAANLWCAYIRQQKGRSIALQSESFGSYSYSLSQVKAVGMPDSVTVILNRYCPLEFG